MEPGDPARTLLCDCAYLWSGPSQRCGLEHIADILVELRAIHNDIRVNETTQLLVAELQMRQNVVNRATENTDNAR